MPAIPRDTPLDDTLALLRDGYDFISNRCARFGTDLFLTRIMGRPCVCIHGRDAARLFYDTSKLERHGAVPRRIVTSLFGKNSVQTLDGRAHRVRKAAFVSLMSAGSLEGLSAQMASEWRRAINGWPERSRVIVFDEAGRVLTRAACSWAGVPLEEPAASRRARDMLAMVDAFGGVGPRLWKGKLARARSERWLAQVITAVRRGDLHVPSGSVLDRLACHRDDSGELLPARTAAVEVLNVLRPTAAVAYYVSFAAHALHRHPEARQRIIDETFGDTAGRYTDQFVQEVRRLYPFTPYLGARVRVPFEWGGHRFEPGTLVLLDVYGTLHDARLWEAPYAFRPERFERWTCDAFDFIPQGGGALSTGHRCPGEWIAQHALALAVHFLARTVVYDVPDQDLSIDLSRMPTRPESGFVLTNARLLPALDAPAPRAPSLSAARDAPVMPEAAAPSSARAPSTQQAFAPS